MNLTNNKLLKTSNNFVLINTFMHVKPEFHVMNLESFIHASIPPFMWPSSWLIHGELSNDHKWWETPLELARNMWLCHVMCILHLLKITWKKIRHPQLPLPFEQCFDKRWMKINTQQNIDEWMIQITYQMFQYCKRAFLH
jgi:hypothetical protein